MANKAIVYAIYPNQIQDEQCQKTFGCCRFVYNQMLTIQQNKYKANEKHLSKMSANTYCNQYLKPNYPFLKEVDKFALTNAIFNLSNRYDRFFKHLGRFPKYKTKRKSQKMYTTNFTNKNIEIGDNYIKLPKLGKVKAKIHRKPDNCWKIKSATVSQSRDGSFYVSVLFEFEQTVVNVPISDNAIGLDYASDGLYVDDKGNVGTNHKYYRESHKKLAKEQRKLSHKIGSRKSESKSNNYMKQLHKVNKIYRHISNQRLDNLHKISTEIANQYDIVCVENLNMRAMSNHGFGNGKATLDNGYGMFLNMLEYKLADRGKYFVKVDKWFRSSQLCHCCGMLHSEMKDMHIRTMRCDCGLIMDRDQNAAINIKFEGLRILKSA